MGVNSEPLEGARVVYRSDTGRVFEGTATGQASFHWAGERWVFIRVPELTRADGKVFTISVPLIRCTWERP